MNTKMDDYIAFVRSLEQNQLETKSVARLLHSLIGMTTEVGELMTILKNYMVYKRPIDWIKFKDELGDLLFYLTMSVDEVSSYDELIDINVAKLKARYPDGFSYDRANNRDKTREARAISDVEYKSGSRQEQFRMLNINQEAKKR